MMGKSGTENTLVEVAVEALGVLAEEAATLEPREKRTVVQWAADERVLDPLTAPIPGRFNWDYTPFWIEPALAMSDPEVRAVIIQKPAQCGGTELTNNVVGWAIDENPVPMMVIMPSERDVSRRVDVRLRAMFQACPSLMRHLGDDLSNLNIGKETILDNCILYLAWASSAAAVSLGFLAKALNTTRQTLH
ncbi:MAG TPA: phage terminase large subunit family protein, partial [bacterium]|nr:phage terminase large subunit family protein [bacterium]